MHGFVEYDLKKDKVLRVAELPDRSGVPREEYLLDSAHHGLAMNPRGTKLCAAGTMDDYAAIVRRKDFKHKLIDVGETPYWATNSGDGRFCFISISGDDRVSVISYRREREVARIKVGDHPQRMRMGASARLSGLGREPVRRLGDGRARELHALVLDLAAPEHQDVARVVLVHPPRRSVALLRELVDRPQDVSRHQVDERLDLHRRVRAAAACTGRSRARPCG